MPQLEKRSFKDSLRSKIADQQPQFFAITNRGLRKKGKIEKKKVIIFGALASNLETELNLYFISR